MNKPLKALGFALSAVLYHAIQTSSNRRTVSLVYEIGVTDGQNIERYNLAIRSKRAEAEMIRTKYGRYAKAVE